MNAEFPEEDKDKSTKLKWINIMGLAMGLPSTIFFSVWGSMQLAKMGVITKTQAVLLFLLIIGNMLFLMVYYAYKRKS